MKKQIIIALLLIFHTFLLSSEEFDPSQYLFMTYNEAARHYFDTEMRDRYFVMEAHFVTSCSVYRRTTDPWSGIEIYTNDPYQDWTLRLVCSTKIPALHRGAVIKVYYKMKPARGGNTDVTVTFIEPVEDKHFILGHQYSNFENLNIRTKPTTSSSIITTIRKYDGAQIIEEGPEETIDGIHSLWVKVKLESGQTGWAFGGYFEIWNE